MSHQILVRATRRAQKIKDLSVERANIRRHREYHEKQAEHLNDAADHMQEHLDGRHDLSTEERAEAQSQIDHARMLAVAEVSKDCLHDH